MKAVGVHSQSLAPLAALVMAILTKYHCQFLRRWPATGWGTDSVLRSATNVLEAPLFPTPPREVENGGGLGGEEGAGTVGAD